MTWMTIVTKKSKKKPLTLCGATHSDLCFVVVEGMLQCYGWRISHQILAFSFQGCRIVFFLIKRVVLCRMRTMPLQNWHESSSCFKDRGLRTRICMYTFASSARDRPGDFFCLCSRMMQTSTVLWYDVSYMFVGCMFNDNAQPFNLWKGTLKSQAI